MKLTKKLEAEIRKLYEVYWNSYINGDLEIYASLLDEEFKFIGSTEAEALLNKKASIKMLDAVKEQMAGKAEFRNRNIKVELIDELIQVSELCDGYILIGTEWNFYSRFRLSSLLKKKRNKWKFIHQHVSMPDSKAQEGEAYGLEQVRTENIQLRDAVKRRTIELEHKNRELEIEAALEKVRVQALGMHKPDDLLNVCKILFKELQVLGFNNLRNAMIDTFVDEKKYLLDYDFSDFTGGSITSNPYSGSPVMEKFISEIRKSNDAFTEIAVTGKELKEWKQFRIANNEKDDPRLHNISVLYYYFYSIGVGAIGISTFSSINEEQREILKRFRNVFDFAYRRYLDVAQAEAQTREAKIEAALEKVRSRSLAMHKSVELQEVVTTVFERLQDLDIQTDAINLDVFNENKKDAYLWTAVPGHQYSKEIHIPYNETTIFKDIYDGMISGKEIHSKVYSRELKDEFLNYVFEHTDFRYMPEERKQMLFATDGSTVSVAYAKNTAIIAQRYRKDAFSDDDNETLKRFARVFEQAYTRFLDLQKAEAQARESQIQLAMERVRARTMAMQRSEELAEVATILFQQVKALGVSQWVCGFSIWEIGDKEFTWYSGSPDGEIKAPCKVPLTEHPVFISFNESRLRGDELFVYEKEGEFQADHYRYMMSVPGMRELLQNMLDAGLSFPTFQIDHIANFSHGNLVFITYEHFPEMHDIFKRFAKVFEQTYTRFLDLQKAEAQARESQIQLALERVRARTMAMQKSDELPETSYLLFQQVKELGLTAVQNSIAIINEEKRFVELSTTVHGHHLPRTLNVPINDPYVMAKAVAAWKAKQKSLKVEVRGQELKDYNEHRNSFFETKVNFPEDQWIVNIIFFSKGWLSFSCDKNISDETFDLLKRFAAVFEQTYTRFNDLKQAEAQAREAQIEAALEKVRSRSMGMQKSEELKEVIQVVYEQFVHLKIKIEHTGFVIDYKARDDYNIWIADPLGVPSQVTVPYFDSVYYNRFNEAKKNGEDFFATNLNFEEKNKFYQKLFEYVPGLPEEAKKFYFSCPGLAASTVLLDNVCLYIENFSGIPYSEEENNTLMRFGKVFQQTYTRFLDLQKAEAQTRDAQIEIAVERVRAKALAMHKSEEILGVVVTLRNELLSLNIPGVSGTTIYLKQDDGQIRMWDLTSVVELEEGFYLSMDIVFRLEETHPELYIRKLWNEPGLYAIQKQDRNDLMRTVDWLGQYKKQEAEDVKKFIEASGLKTLFHSTVPLANGKLSVDLMEAPPAEMESILHKMATAFDLAYKRFLDLQKAEAQAREAKIEAALEKVRASTMAMQHSDHLSETAFVLFKQFKELGEAPERIFIATFDNEQDGIIDIWGTNQGGNQLDKLFKVPADEPTVISKIITAWKEKKRSVIIDLSGEELKQYISFLKSTGMPITEGVMEDRRVQTIGCFSKGVIGVTTPEPQSTESVQLLERFASVFDLTYTRFLDLQQAEAQAREARIEAALERVRSHTMAMHHSDELKEVISVTFEQIKSLNIIIDSCIITLFIEGSDDLNNWVASAEQKYPHNVRVPYFKHPLFDKIVLARKNPGNYFTIKLSQKENQIFYKHILENSDFGKIINEDRRKLVMKAESNIMSFANFKHTGLRVGNFCDHTYTQGENNTILRFANVFEQTYTRFLDLQKAEEQARETIKQASVDRVRAEIASMRTTNDLEGIQPLIWNELTTLGVPFTRCGVFIMDEEHEQVDTFLSTPDGKSIASFTSNYSDVAVITEALPYWRKKEIYKAHWDEATFLAQAQTLLSQGNITSTETYLTEHRPKDLYLHFLPFLQGILYVGNETPLKDDELQLVQNLADAFSIAYARYEDFNKLELAKEQIENTLTNLKQAQAQLVQSEKMASLGELTAGIAHEIQNPLNFVNNFSEVNTELIAEMKEEIEKGNIEEVKAIANDIADNEQKINHHGKRADAIVKGMLQHSRSSSGVKEPSDINVLADEYLRLAYHGLRAKDKSFNATMKTDYDATIGKINIVPQEVGRSVLNLITNAFYAVSEKKKQIDEGLPAEALAKAGYEPTVTVTTKRINGKVEIRVADNGNGIPRKVLDKIFQPFFTTKPTGQGTGLGLSLSYDIVKAHNGELEVKTKEGEGSEFIIFLPANN